MQFKNISVFTISGKTEPEEMPILKQADSLQYTIGWLPVNNYTGELTVETQGATLYRFGRDEKVIPSSVLKQELEKKVREIEQSETRRVGRRRVGRREKADIEYEIALSLLPRAFNKTTSVFLYIDKATNMMVIDSCSSKNIDGIYELIQMSFSELKIQPLMTDISPSSEMSEWLLKNSVPSSLETGDECTVDNEESKISFKGLEPLSDDTTRHLEQGMSVESLALTWKEKVSFALNSSLQIKKIKFLDVLMDAHNESLGEQSADLVSDFSLNVLTFRELIDSIKLWFSDK